MEAYNVQPEICSIQYMCLLYNAKRNDMDNMLLFTKMMKRLLIAEEF
jgi:hypothetical protein